ncbi:MAG: hypothetical protein ABI769_16065 [Pseudomonadota bacterium]
MSVKVSALFSIVSLLFAAGAVQAQTAGVVTLRANSTTGQGSLVPVLTWSTNPVATSCRASGGWSGNKTVSGTETLASINASTNYTLTCSWGTGTATVTWTAPTTNTDNSALTNLAGFRVYYSTSNTSFSSSTTVNDMAARTTTISALTPGTWYFMARALNSSQEESADSNIRSKTVTGATAAGTVAIVISAAPPPPPTRKTISTTAYDVRRSSTTGAWVLGRVVGTVPLGTACRTYTIGGGYYGVQTGYVTVTLAPRTTTIVARCSST